MTEPDRERSKTHRPKKSLGQHFLTSPATAAFIASAACGADRPVVVEIGPGEGVLTEPLLDRAQMVIAIEKDESLASSLSAHYANEIREGRLQIIAGDALVTTPEGLGLASGLFVLAANIPYYITGEILRVYLSGAVKPKRVVLLVQKEVAERVVAKDGKESILSLSVKRYGTPRYLKTVKAGSFNPPPKVDSAVLAIEDIATSTPGNDEAFFKAVKAGFGQKRKQLGSTLGENYGKQKALEALAQCSIPSSQRPERLTLKEWECLSEALEN